MIIYILLFDTKYDSNQIEVFDSEEKLNRFIGSMEKLIRHYEIIEKEINRPDLNYKD